MPKSSFYFGHELGQKHDDIAEIWAQLQVARDARAVVHANQDDLLQRKNDSRLDAALVDATSISNTNRLNMLIARKLASLFM